MQHILLLITIQYVVGSLVASLTWGRVVTAAHDCMDNRLPYGVHL